MLPSTLSYLVTGGTGSLGTALIANLLADPAVSRVCSFSRDEVKAGDLTARFSHHHAKLRTFLGDVRDEARLLQALQGIDVVIHAAALKRVTESVYSPGELIRTNIQGTINVVAAAWAAKVKRVLVISSDKAVMPTNLYGMTKAVAECYAVQANSYTYPHGTLVSCVRYGNVIGSRGSVLPYWVAEARAGRPIRLTDPGMTRFFLSLADAVRLIRDVVPVMGGGEVFVPRLHSATMGDLADAINRAVGPAQIIQVGVRPGGEKQHESLLSDEEVSRTVHWVGPPFHARVFLVVPSYQTWSVHAFSSNVVERKPDAYTSDQPFRLMGRSVIERIVEDVLTSQESCYVL